MNAGDAVEFNLGRKVKRGTVTRVLKISVWVKDERGQVWSLDKGVVKAIDNTTQRS